MNAPKPTSSTADWAVLKNLFAFVKPYRKAFYGLVVLTLLSGTLGPLQPFLIQRTIDRYITPGNYPGLLRMVLLSGSLLTLQVIVQYCSTYLADWLGQRSIKSLRIQLYAHIMRLRASFLNRTPVGTLVTRNISDT